MLSKTDTKGRWTILVALTVVAGAALRVIALDSGLWYDEIMTLVLSARHPIRQVLTDFPGVNAHPLYSVLAHASLVSFGESAWALRLPAFLFGVASIIVVYVLGVRLMTRIEAWVAAAILATSYHHIWFSQNARGYTLIGFLTLVSTLFLLRVRETRRWQDLAVYAVTCAAGIYTHLTMAFVVGGHVAVILIGRLANWRQTNTYALRPVLMAWTGVAVLSGIAYAPFVQGLIALMNLPETRETAQVATRMWALGDAIRSILSGTGVPAALVGACFALVGAISLWRREPLAWALLLAPTIVTGLAIAALGQPIRPRFFFFLSAAAALFVGRGVGAAVAFVRERGTVGHRLPEGAGIVACTVGLISLSAVALPKNYQVPKQDYAGAVAYLDDAEARGAVITSVWPSCNPIELYYEKPWPCSRTLGEWRVASAHAARVLTVYSLADYIQDPALRDELRSACPTVQRFPGTLSGGDLVVCDASGRVRR